MSGLFICIISEKCLKHVWDTVDISGKNDLKSFDFKISEVHGFYYIIILNKTVIQKYCDLHHMYFNMLTFFSL